VRKKTKKKKKGGGGNSPGLGLAPCCLKEVGEGVACREPRSVKKKKGGGQLTNTDAGAPLSQGGGVSIGIWSLQTEAI